MRIPLLIFFLVLAIKNQFSWALIGSSSSSSSSSSKLSSSVKRILYLPLDERFTTRDLLLNLGKITSFEIETPPKDLLSKWKTPADLDSIDNFIEERISSADLLLISAELYLYGGLIASRISNDTTTEILSRLGKLFSYSRKYPNLDIYVSNVVMRIPSYNGDFEEPWYWADYGYDLYTYSFYTDKYSQTNDDSDYNLAEAAKQKVPSSALDEFIWRRSRNHNITMSMLNQMKVANSKKIQNVRSSIENRTETDTKSIFTFLYTTLDDSAEYGFNIREAAEIKNFITDNADQIDQTSCPVYPGADEVHLTMLSKYAVEVNRGGKPIRFLLAFKNESTIKLIPGYEGQPMIDTLNQQILAAGGTVVSYDETNSDIAYYDTLLLVNNFEDEPQNEASLQPTSLSESQIEKYSNQFDAKIKEAASQGIIIGYCDNNYANGGDLFFRDYMFNSTKSVGIGLDTVAYAGWNTNGNTIGTVVANSIILTLFSDRERGRLNKANVMFNTLRILEDVYYQSRHRQDLKTYVGQINPIYGESSSNLTADLSFYDRYSYKLLQARFAEDIKPAFALSDQVNLRSIFFPWNRTFEIGLCLNFTSGQTPDSSCSV